MQARITNDVTRCTYYLSHWQGSVKFWERMAHRENTEHARKQVRRFQTKLQWANQRAALYTVR